MKLARLQDAIPLVASDAARDALFPSPALDQRCQNLRNGGGVTLERWTGSAWGTDATLSALGGYRTPEDFLAAGDGVTNDTDAWEAAIAALPEHGGDLSPRPGGDRQAAHHSR